GGGAWGGGVGVCWRGGWGRRGGGRAPRRPPARFGWAGGRARGTRHTHEDLPILIAGGGAAGMSGGRHVVCPQETALANLFLTVLADAGVSVDQVGDSSGHLAL